MAKILHARAQIVQKNFLVLDNGRAHATVADQASEAGPGLGPTPLELCVMSHAGCYATICASAAQKMRLTLKSCDVKVEAIKSDETGTISEETMDITLDIDAPMDRIERLHEVTLKTCPVGIIFEKAGIKTTYNLKLKQKQIETDKEKILE